VRRVITAVSNPASHAGKTGAIPVRDTICPVPPVAGERPFKPSTLGSIPAPDATSPQLDRSSTRLRTEGLQVQVLSGIPRSAVSSDHAELQIRLAGCDTSAARRSDPG
jgi:hypothetical protein